MSQKFLIALLLLAALAGAGWMYRGEEPLRSMLPAGLSGVKPKTAGPAMQPAPPPGLRKCKQGSQVLYTNDDCPKGSTEQPITRGAVTVLPSQAPADAPAGAAGGVPKNTEQLGKMMGKDAATELRDKRMDRATSK